LPPRGRRAERQQPNARLLFVRDGSWYREESKEMERTIRNGRQMEKAGVPNRR